MAEAGASMPWFIKLSGKGARILHFGMERGLHNRGGNTIFLGSGFHRDPCLLIILKTLFLQAIFLRSGDEGVRLVDNPEKEHLVTSEMGKT